jgi:hypothetical protein
MIWPAKLSHEAIGVELGQPTRTFPVQANKTVPYSNTN